MCEFYIVYTLHFIISLNEPEMQKIIDMYEYQYSCAFVGWFRLTNVWTL